MWEKIKEYVYGGLLAISLLVGGYIYSLTQKVKKLSSEKEALEGEIYLNKEVNAYEEAKENANDSEAEYISARDKLLKSDFSDSE